MYLHNMRGKFHIPGLFVCVHGLCKYLLLLESGTKFAQIYQNRQN